MAAFILSFYFMFDPGINAKTFSAKLLLTKCGIPKSHQFFRNQTWFGSFLPSGFISFKPFSFFN